jgi:UDP-N-acetylmuramate dehydrogenase
MNMSEPKQFRTEELRGKWSRDVPMRRYTSWRAGGNAERMYQPADLADLQAFLRALPAGEPLTAVGLGSNLLVRDGGLRGTVLMLHGALNELRLETDNLIYAEAGVPGAKLARFAASHNLHGAAFFAGIPGTLGGMLAMNAGCYGSETWGKVERVLAVDRSGALHERTPLDYEVGYRHVQPRSKPPSTASGITSDLADVIGQPSRMASSSIRGAGGEGKCSEIFTAAWLKFPSGDGGIARQEIKALLDKRIASQPLNLPNAGSVFRNPPNDHAARLIEQCGLKGKRIGGAQVSEKHANFIVNTGNATAADIENLIAEVGAIVLKQTGIALHPEVRIIGEHT